LEGVAERDLVEFAWKQVVVDADIYIRCAKYPRKKPLLLRSERAIKLSR
jgi:hypothetical protein